MNKLAFERWQKTFLYAFCGLQQLSLLTHAVIHNNEQLLPIMNHGMRQ